MKKSNFTGLGRVYKFTIQQYYKDVKVIKILCAMFLASILIIPIMSLIVNRNVIKESDIKHVYLINETPYNLIYKNINKEDVVYKNICITETNDKLHYLIKHLKVRQNSNLIVRIFFDKSINSYKVNAYKFPNSYLNNSDISRFIDKIKQKFCEGRITACKVTRKQISTIFTECTVNVLTADMYEGKIDNLTYTVIMYIYSAILVILIVMTSDAIGNNIVVEKSSKVIDYLLISIRPLAIVFGKILAVMTETIINILFLVLGLVISYLISGIISNNDYINDLFIKVNLNFVLSNINYKVILIVVFSCIIGYLLNSLLSGVVGACCDNMEDYSQLKIVTILPVFLGFNITMLSLNFYNANFIYFTSLFPFVSMFSAPINFICGKISLILLLISWVIQLICIYILFSFSAKVYQGILFYKGNKINLKQLILISKYERGYCNRENRNSSTVD